MRLFESTVSRWKRTPPERLKDFMPNGNDSIIERSDIIGNFGIVDYGNDHNSAVSGIWVYCSDFKELYDFLFLAMTIVEGGIELPSYDLCKNTAYLMERQ